MNLKRFCLIILFSLILVGTVCAITYSYTPETNLIWGNGKAQGKLYDYAGGDITELSHVKILKLGVLHIGDLPTNQSSGTSIMLVGLPPAPVQVNGTFVFHNGSVTDKVYNGMQVAGNVKVVVRLVAQYFPHNGVATMIDLGSGGDKTIELWPEYKKTELNMTIYLVIGESMRMQSAETYYIDNISDYMFTLKDNSGNLIEGEGINTVNNPFTGGGSGPTWSGTEGAVQPAQLNATLTLLGYPDMNPLGQHATMALPSSIQTLMSGVNLVYLQTDFALDNADAGQTKDLLVTISHDSLTKPGSGTQYDYALALEQQGQTGTVETQDMTQGYSVGDLSYRLVNSSAGDTDMKLLKFRFLSDDFQNAAIGRYSSTVRFELAVLN